MRYYATRIPAALITFVLGIASANLAAYVWGASSDERDVLAVEREYVRAHVERDVAALDRVLADDFSMFGGGSRRSTGWRSSRTRSSPSPRSRPPTCRWSSTAARPS